MSVCDGHKPGIKERDRGVSYSFCPFKVRIVVHYTALFCVVALLVCMVTLYISFIAVLAMIYT